MAAAPGPGRARPAWMIVAGSLACAAATLAVSLWVERPFDMLLGQIAVGATFVLLIILSTMVNVVAFVIRRGRDREGPRNRLWVAWRIASLALMLGFILLWVPLLGLRVAGVHQSNLEQAGALLGAAVFLVAICGEMLANLAAWLRPPRSRDILG